MKKILVLYYTQTGQIKDILDSIFKKIDPENTKIDFYRIHPAEEYPFPWQPISTFFDVFPESVKGVNIPINALNVNNSDQYDLVIIGLQVWYLSPSIPISSFLKSNEAKIILNNKPVITVYGTRNMWVSAHKTVKDLIKNAGGKLKGNIVFSDKHHNLLSVISIVRWMTKGKKESRKYFIDAGVSKKDIADAEKFGGPITDALNTNNFENLRNEFFKLEADKIDYHIMKIELNGKRIFQIWAGLILRKSNQKPRKRKQLLILFKYYLFFVIYIVSPFASVIFFIKKIIFPGKVKKEIIMHTS